MTTTTTTTDKLVSDTIFTELQHDNQTSIVMLSEKAISKNQNEINEKHVIPLRDQRNVNYTYYTFTKWSLK